MLMRNTPTAPAMTVNLISHLQLSKPHPACPRRALPPPAPHAHALPLRAEASACGRAHSSVGSSKTSKRQPSAQLRHGKPDSSRP
eukprot:6184046-Pleurochrysis_carterae.AAC.5